MVDKSGSSIGDKYHHARLHVPLNEVPLGPNTAPAVSFYNYVRTRPATTGSASTVGARCRADIQGANGYSLRTLQDAAGFVTIDGGGGADANDGFGALEEFTFVIHFTSDSSGLQYVFSQGPAVDSADAMSLSIDGTSGYPIFSFTDAEEATHTLTGKTSVASDGETPMCVIVTYQSGSQAGPAMQLFVNGTREDYLQDITGSMATTPDIRIGSDDAGTPATVFDGTIEEILIYDRCYYIPEDGGTYKLNTADLADKDSSGKLTHNARLFAYDYHNIRGKSKDKVAQSHEVNWGTTI